MKSLSIPWRINSTETMHKQRPNGGNFNKSDIAIFLHCHIWCRVQLTRTVLMFIYGYYHKLPFTWLDKKYCDNIRDLTYYNLSINCALWILMIHVSRFTWIDGQLTLGDVYVHMSSKNAYNMAYVLLLKASAVTVKLIWIKAEKPIPIIGEVSFHTEKKRTPSKPVKGEEEWSRCWPKSTRRCTDW